MNAPFEHRQTSTVTPENDAPFPTYPPIRPSDPNEPSIERGYDKRSASEAEKASIPRPVVIDTTYLAEEDRTELDEIIGRGRSNETAHYHELMQSISEMGGQAVMSSILAGEISQHQLVAVNFAKRVGTLGSTLSLDYQEKLTDRAIESLSKVPEKVEVDELLKEEAHNAHDIVRQKDAELRRKDQELEALRDYLKEERDKLLPEWALMDEDDPQRAFLDAKIKKLGTLINPSLDTTFTKRMPTTGELEESIQHVTPEDVSPARGLSIALLAEKALGALGIHTK